MKYLSFFLLVLMMLSSLQAWGAEIVTDDRYFKIVEDFNQHLSDEDIESVYASREAALADIKVMESHLNKLTQFRQSNERSYGLPSDPAELEQMRTQARAFADNELKAAKSLFNSMLEKYNVSNMEELSSLTSRIINPGGPINPTGIPSTVGLVDRSVQWVEEFIPQLETALTEAQQQAAETNARLNAAKTISEFPGDSYSGGDLAAIKSQMLAALLGNVTKSNDEVLDIAVTSNWNEGIYTDTKQAYRKIMGTVLFADKDGDGVSRYTSYIFISNKADGNWQQLKFKAFNASIEGWAEPRKGDLGSPAGKGFIGTLMWLLLAVVNIIAGLVVSRTLLQSKLPVMEKITKPLQPFSMVIGLVAMGVGILGFILSVLSLQLFSGIIPQLSAVLMGVLLAREFIKSMAKGKIKEQIEGNEALLNQVGTYSQIIGAIGLVVGVLYLILGGSLYII
jgi:hypothetical protein